MAYSPRKRARRHFGRMRTWGPSSKDGIHALGFAGWKAGMTHVMVRDVNPHSPSRGQEIRVPVTVVEFPTMRVLGVRGYTLTPYGKQSVGEAWWSEAIWPSRDTPPNELPESFDGLQINRRLIPRSGAHDIDANLDRLRNSDLAEVRLIVCTEPSRLGVPSKTPEVMEIGMGGDNDPIVLLESASERIGERMQFSELFSDGDNLDVVGITKGHGWQGVIKRFGGKLLSHKNSKRRRQHGNMGDFGTGYVRKTIRQGGQMGFHQRTEYNKRILRISTPEDHEVTPEGGFLHYGVIREGNEYAIIKGSLPGPAGRLLLFRHSVRKSATGDPPEITYVSTASKQGA